MLYTCMPDSAGAIDHNYLCMWIFNMCSVIASATFAWVQNLLSDGEFYPVQLSVNILSLSALDSHKVNCPPIVICHNQMPTL